MARCPLAVWMPLPEQGRQRATEAKRLAIVHSAAGASQSLYDFFRNSTDLESHFFIALDGTIEQYLDTDQRADANRFANDEAVSIETGDYGDPDNLPWNPAQERSLVRLLDWICDTHPQVTRQLATGPDGHGIGYHTMWGSPSHWTPVAKSCPGRARIKQFPGILWQVAVLGLPEGGDDLQADERLWLKTLYDTFGSPTPNNGPGTTPRVLQVLDGAMWNANRIKVVEQKVAEAAAVADTNSRMLRAIVDHLGIEPPNPTPPVPQGN